MNDPVARICKSPHLVCHHIASLQIDPVVYSCLDHGHDRVLGLDDGADGGVGQHTGHQNQARCGSHLDFESDFVSDGFFHLDDFDHVHHLPSEVVLMKRKSFLQVMVSEHPRAEPSTEAVDE